MYDVLKIGLFLCQTYLTSETLKSISVKTGRIKVDDNTGKKNRVL